VFSRISYTGPGAAVPPFTDPRALFDYAFADLEVDPEAADKLALRRGSVLDHVGESISSLQAELGAADRIRLQEHLDAVRELEQSLQAGTALGCTIPDTPGAPGSYDDDLQARVDVMMDLCAMILRCDLTRVLVFSLGSSSCQLFYPFLGLDRKDHDISHWSPTAPTDRDEYVAMSAWKVAQFAKFLDRLIATSEGDATLLDNCGVACASELCDGTLHDDQVLPVLVAGGLGGMEGGRHIVVPCTATPQIVARNPGFAGICGSGTTPLANLWLTMLHAAGVDADTFGNSTGTVPDLWV
jgi:hypothetical protein